MENNWKFESAELLEFLGEKIAVFGTEKPLINDCCTIGEPRNGCLMFATTKKWKKEYSDRLKAVKSSVIIAEDGIRSELEDFGENGLVIISDNARLTFAESLKFILDTIRSKRKYTVKDNITFGENVKIGKNCVIEPFVFIDHDCVLEDNVVICTGTKIRENVTIGANSVIGNNCVIGAQGFGIESGPDNRKVRIPHIGGVRIGRNVEVGSLVSITAGTILPTLIEDNCFIDDLTHIAHNCHFGKGTLAAACGSFGGSFTVGENGYFATNVTMRNGISLGDDCFVGQGSSVQKSFGNNVSLVGNPAREFNRNRK